jgi:AraC-like DNA-binding protein
MHIQEIEGFRDLISRAVVFREECPPLAKLGILEVGITHASGEWCFCRPAPAFSLILVTIAGRGRVAHEDRWQEIGQDTAYILPRGAPHGYRVAPGADWHYAWVKFDDSSHFSDVFRSPVPVVTSAAAYSVHATNRGLIEETGHGNDPHLAGMWCDLINASLHHLTRPQKIDLRLASLWVHVNERLGDAWDIASLSRRASLSREHLRRLCLRDHGHSPRRHLTLLRLRRSCELLALTNATLFSIAVSVGFSDEFSFSQSFKRAFGTPPSAYRAKARESIAPTGLA